MSISTNPESKEPNGHNINTPPISTNMSTDNNASNTNPNATPTTTPPKTTSTDSQLMKDIIEHLRLKGLDSIANDLESKTDNKNGKRSFSEMNGSESYLRQIYNSNFSNKSNLNSKHLISEEQVMSSSYFSLQSFGEYYQLFVHANKSEISCISFSNNGLFNCIGCNDGTIRIFDVNKLHQSRNFNSLIKKYDSNSYSDIHRPLISTLNSGFMYDKNDYKINEIDFHPHLDSTQQLVSCYSNGINFYEFKKQNRKSPIQSIKECFNIRSVQYHPSGQYIIVGGESFYIRLYDIEKYGQGYIANKNDNKDYNINQIRYSYGGGNIFASCSDSGDIRLYDARSLSVVNTLNKFHKNQSITSIRFSKNCKYLLSYGKDNIIRLCDLRIGKECMNYINNYNKNNKQTNNNIKMRDNGQACFTYNDEHILCYSAISNRIFVYDTNTGHRINKFKDHISSNNQKNYITYLATSKTEPAFMSASLNDNKNRFYATVKQISDGNNNNNNNSNTLQNLTNQNHRK